MRTGSGCATPCGSGRGRFSDGPTGAVGSAGGDRRAGRGFETGVAGTGSALLVADLHATVLHLLGLDHRRVTYHVHGRDERLTDVYDAKVLNPLLAKRSRNVVHSLREWTPPTRGASGPPNREAPRCPCC